MLKNFIIAANTILLVTIIGCAFGAPKPGTGGKSSSRKIESGHQEVPDGVNCYVCHKRDIPEEEFHKKFGITCEKCHGNTTWMAYKYPHESWPLGIHRKMQCSRCHSNIQVYDFSVWQCWGCHHDKKETEDQHKKLGFEEINNCIQCHKGSKESN